MSNWPLVDKMEAKAQGRNVVFTAIETFKDTEEIQEFYQQYILWLIEKHGKNPQEAKATADSNFGYVIYYYDKATIQLWEMALQDIGHPALGRSYSGTPDETFQKGVEWGKKLAAK